MYKSKLVVRLKLFRTLIQTYPTSKKVPDILFTIGMLQKQLGRPTEGTLTLSRLMKLYPNSQAAQRASVQLSSQ